MDYIHLEQPDRARTLMEETLDRVEREAFGSHRWRWKIRLLVGLGQLWKMKQEPEKALQLLHQGLKLAIDTGSRKYVTEVKGLRGEILLVGGQREEGFRELQEALTLAQEMASPALIWRVARLLGQAYVRLQDINSAFATYQLALNTITTVADRIGNRELREVFLTSSEVASLREEFTQLGKMGV
jgi:tetratricopeptide (TPR) repeat protein